MFGKRKKLRKSLKRKFGTECSDRSKERTKNKIDLIALFHKEMMDVKEDDCIDDITWDDLQMNDVFVTINHSNSFIGEQYLYHRMHRPEKQGEKFEHTVQLFASDEKLRIDVQERLASIGKRRNENYYLASLLMRAGEWKIRYMWVIHLMQILLIAGILIGSISKIKMVFGGLIPIVLINLMIYVYTKNRYEVFLFSLGTLKQIICMGSFLSDQHISALLDVPEEMAGIIQELRPLSKQITIFNHIMNVIDGKQGEILKLFEYIGELDLSISAASYRASIKQYCIPQIKEIENIECEDLRHPLIKKPVGNDFNLVNRAIITGGNAAGKSTFLKALAINVILAKSINTCTAKRFQMPDIFVMTSMALRDDVISGESYYIREAKRIKQMLDLKGKRSLHIIDEMLKGTNTFERVSASISILSYLSKTNHFVIVATHDPQLGESLSSYEKYYFDSVISNDAILFDYKIHKGDGGKTNAIALLSLLHYPEEIVEQSRKELRKYSAN